MRYQTFPGGHWVIRIDAGEEVMTTLRSFCAEHEIKGAHFMAFGAFEKVRLSCWTPSESRFEHHTFDRQTEVVSLLGNIGWYNDKPVIHAHAAVGDYSQQTFSGHLEEGIANPTIEIFLTDLGAELSREHDEKTGLKVLSLAKEKKAA